ncbi:MAG: serine hydrolase [Saprospiraceae bacterium]|nr:serine hydrolase [Saprospiraceae bacterium]
MHHFIRILSLTATIGLFSFQALAQQVSFQDTIARIDKLFENWNTDTPGGVLTVSRKGQIIYNKAFGMADLEHHIANTTETIFEAGSVSKQFTTTAIFLLAMEGKLSLDDEVRKYVPELPDYGDKLTIRHMIHHISGLRDWGSVASISGWGRGVRTHTHAHALEILSKQKALNFKPGDQYSYCNSGYNLMAIVVDRVSGMPFAEFCKQRIFEPMGMSNTQWRDDYRKIVHNRSIAYSRSNGAYLQDMPFEMVYGNGGLLTTTADLVKWNTHYKNPVIGGEKLVNMQMQQGKLNNNVIISYAGGIVINHYNNFTEINHSGATAGYRAWLAYYIEPDISIAFLSNEGNANPGRIGAEVAEIFLGERENDEPMLGTIVPDEKSLQAKTGLYRCLRNDDIMELEVKDKLLQVKNGQILQATKENTFFQGSTRMEFSNNKFIMYTSNGDSATYVKKEPFKPSEKDLQLFTGTYNSDEADAIFTFDIKDGKLRGFRSPDTYFFLTPLYRDTFRTNNGALVEFKRDKANKINGFGYSISRASNVIFDKIK